MSKPLVILDAGHNEYVLGKEAPDKSMREWEFNNAMQYLIKPRLEELGFNVYLTNPSPAKKNEIGLAKRATLANDKWKALGKPNALFVSLHANAYGVWTEASGCETYLANNGSTKSKNAATIVQKHIHQTLVSLKGTSINRGVKSANFTVIKNANMPSILIEYAFYTNKKDLVILKNNRNELAEATIKALCEYFGVVYKEKQQEQPKKDTQFKPYLARCTVDNLNCRKGAGTSYEIERQINKGVAITIVEEKMNGSTKWGKSLSGYWVALKYMQFIRYI